LITNRHLAIFHYIARDIGITILLGGLAYGFVVKIINGEGYLGFMMAFMAFMKDYRLPWFDEAPHLLFTERKEEKPK
jgi:hypothetical protein